MDKTIDEVYVERYIDIGFNVPSKVADSTVHEHILALHGD